MKTSLIGAGIVLLVSLPLMPVTAALSLSLFYLIFIYLPFLPLVERINTGVIEKFLLTNMAGLSYAGIYVWLDVFFKIPLTKLTYIIVTGLILVGSWGYFFYKGSD